MIKFENVSVTYPGGVEALKDLDLEINEGDFLIIVGLSGAGKSTLLRTINNLVKPSNGVVFLDNKDITNANKKQLKQIRSQIGMIFQTFNLVNRSTVLKNVLTGRLSKVSTIRSVLGLWPKDQKQMAFEALNQVEILEKAYVRASNLSGGQQQRVGIARALSQKPKVMLADEPVASLDPITSRVVMSYLKKNKSRTWNYNNCELTFSWFSQRIWRQTYWFTRWWTSLWWQSWRRFRWRLWKYLWKIYQTIRFNR